MVASSIVCARSLMFTALAFERLPLASLHRPTLLPRMLGIEAHLLPVRIRCVFQISREVGKLFDLRGQHRDFDAAVLTVRDRPEQLRVAAGPRHRGVQYLALADQLRGEPCSAAALAGRTSQNQGIAAVLDDGMRLALAVRARHLGNRLKAED